MFHVYFNPHGIDQSVTRAEEQAELQHRKLYAGWHYASSDRQRGLLVVASKMTFAPGLATTKNKLIIPDSHERSAAKHHLRDLMR